MKTLREDRILLIQREFLKGQMKACGVWFHYKKNTPKWKKISKEVRLEITRILEGGDSLAHLDLYCREN